MIVHSLPKVREVINSLPSEDRMFILADISSLQMEKRDEVSVKTLRGKIKELITRQYRIVFFAVGIDLYFVDVFKTQSKKTPPRIIKRAEKIYKMVINQII